MENQLLQRITIDPTLHPGNALSSGMYPGIALVWHEYR